MIPDSNNYMKIKIYLQQIAAQVGQELERLLPEENDESALAAAMRYSVFNGGKRLRPALFCSTAEALGMDYRPLLPYAAALEMIHCYSLIHDDLPAMDNDDLRRGKPTCHIVYGEDMAILAGDDLLTLASEILSRPLPEVDPARQLAAAREIMTGAGEMVRGQALEIAAGSRTIDLPLLRQIYYGKTAALFKAAVLSAAQLAGAGQRQMAELAVYCLELGLAFQIADDILDVHGDEALVGKRLGSDQKNAKITFVSLLGCEDAAQQARDAAARARQAVASWDEKAELLRLYPDFFVQRDH